MRFRRLTEEGLQVFARWLEHGEGLTPPASLIDGDLTEEGLAVDIDETESFPNRFAFGSRLATVLAGFSLGEVMAIREDATWAWLSVIFFQQLRKPNRKTGRFQGTEHFIVQRKGLKGSLAYRQGARTSFELVRVHGDAAKLCLLRPMNTFGDTAEQLASRIYLARNAALFGAAAALYLRNGAVVRGASSYPTPPAKRRKGDRKGYGGLRRLERHLDRLQLTHDTDAMEPADLVSLLPTEFDRHRPAAAAQ